VDALIDGLASAMADLSAGGASVPDRVAALVPEREGFLAAMPGFVPSARVLMSKLVSLFPHNAGTELIEISGRCLGSGLGSVLDPVGDKLFCVFKACP
jgi:ornithine cyclodeaminase/alanine dehydrogenase-like protein (mu-crystallin family)